MDMYFACIADVLTNHRGWRIGSCKHKNLLCVMHEIHVFDRNVQFANCLYCIKRWQYASGYSYGLQALFQCTISFWSTAIGIKSTVA